MGYNSYIYEGSFTFSRPLNAPEVRAFRQALSATDYASYFLNLDVTERVIETDDGTLTKISAESLTPVGNQGKAYGLIADLESLINALPSDVTVSGYIERIGEEFPDAERIYVLGRRVVSVKAEIVWPEPS